jgi:uncharacterized protein (DUF2236 family)
MSPGPGSGLFASGSAIRQVNREAALLVAGPRALLLQLAHPLVAAGVAEHSTFLVDPLARLHATLERTLGIVFGEREEALAHARAIREAHARVHGALREGTAAFPAGTPYDANDPELQLWVHATLVDSALVAYERFVATLDAATRDAFVAESGRVAALIGVPEAVIPADHASLCRYFDGVVAGPVLEVTPSARRLADAVLHPPIRFVPRAAGDLASVLTLGLLPPEIRARYGFPWSPARERAHAALAATLRAAVPLLPRGLRVFRAARRSLSAVGGRSAPTGRREG